MKDKAFELLKELLLLQSAGGFDMYNQSIEIAIDIYCELANKDRNNFKADLIAISSFIWSKRNSSNFNILQQNYAMLIDNLNYER